MIRGFGNPVLSIVQAIRYGLARRPQARAGIHPQEIVKIEVNRKLFHET